MNGSHKVFPRSLSVQLLLVDIGFIVYWTLTALHAIPTAWAFKDYDLPQVVAWNWSFLPLDAVLSATGLAALWQARKGDVQLARCLALISLSLTHASGLMAISYWAIAGDFDLGWWLPNLWLMLFPLPYLVLIARRMAQPQ